MNRKLLLALVLLAVISTGLFAARSWYGNNNHSLTPDKIEFSPEQKESTAEPVKEETAVAFVEQEYGYSGNNRPLTCCRISNNNTDIQRKILCVFAIHGFEDAFYQDGRLLVDIASDVIEYFKKYPGDLGNYELLVVPCANPDGVNEGWTCNGPGRCQLSQGIDINMDFDYHFKVRENPRNQTGEAPFTSPESRALRDLVLSENPDIIIDFHGWVNSAAGDPELCAVFCEGMGLSHETVEEAIYPGFFSGWALDQGKAVLVEFPDPFSGEGAYEKKTEDQINYDKSFCDNLNFSSRTIDCIKEIAARNL